MTENEGRVGVVVGGTFLLSVHSLLSLVHISLAWEEEGALFCVA